MAQTIIINTRRGKVREELFRLSGQNEWNENNLWTWVLKTGNAVFEEIYLRYLDKDWSSPGVAQLAIEKFIEKPPASWMAPENKWVLAGGWLTSRKDIVAWMRSSYWKYNRKRMSLERDHRNALAMSAAAALSLATHFTAASPAAAKSTYFDSTAVPNRDREVNPRKKSWKEVVLA